MYRAYFRHDGRETGGPQHSYHPSHHARVAARYCLFVLPGGGSQVTPPGRLGSRWSIENGEVARANRAKVGAKAPAPCRFKRLCRRAGPWCELMYPQPGNKKSNSAPTPSRLEQPQLRLRPCFSPYRVSPGRLATARSVQTPVSPGWAEGKIQRRKTRGANTYYLCNSTCNLSLR